ncbi:glycosyltransferase family 4 protein [Burkholderia sp. AU19243]|uniref:MraY family glycosyltransferase n=1 Tax=Burkholderia TaxID=32008 RepID=UPI001AE6D6B4|nr:MULTISPECIES: glycosyltransferase family 4 protein [Burkholderia]MBR7963270.1 glycosyltransferase family 4 protein [Burkholderia vietnamiensis]MBR8140835.1 glycosyltransferase family 4 protein [Burkholderia vietnamiensis]MBR8361792.1 glycosyltransferase family 4 protein [Burkholderia sp. AU19243]QTO44067.1 glycosyltransferase family 4 protein [Burkholderia latens]
MIVSLPIVAVAVFAACASFAMLVWMLKSGLAWRLAVDVPNQRSLHERPVPRVGGWGVMCSALPLIALGVPGFGWAALGAFVLAVVSLIDDRRGLSARARFSVHVLGAAGAVWASSIELPLWAIVLVVVALVWIVNLYNFMDGANGLAAGMTVLGFGTYAIAAARVAPELATASGVVAGAGLGFLVLNFGAAKVFLGDVGSIPLGFLAGAFGLWGWQHGVWPVWFVGMAFAPFIADASVTLMRRLLRGEKVWQAHREHAYQRLVRTLGSHVPVALLYYALMVGGSAAGLAALQLRSVAAQWAVVVAWYALLGVVGAWIDWRWRKSGLTR